MGPLHLLLGGLAVIWCFLDFPPFNWTSLDPEDQSDGDKSKMQEMDPDLGDMIPEITKRNIALGVGAIAMVGLAASLCFGHSRSPSEEKPNVQPTEDVITTLQRAATGKMELKELKKNKTVLIAGLVVIASLGFSLLMLYLCCCRKKRRVNSWKNRRIAAKKPPVHHRDRNSY